MMNREKQKKEQKTFEYIENPEQIEGFDKIPVPEDLDQRVHSAAAAADKMDLLYIVQQMLAIIRVHEHSKALLQILTAAAQTDSFQIWGHTLII